VISNWKGFVKCVGLSSTVTASRHTRSLRGPTRAAQYRQARTVRNIDKRHISTTASAAGSTSSHPQSWRQHSLSPQSYCILAHSHRPPPFRTSPPPPAPPPTRRKRRLWRPLALRVGATEVLQAVVHRPCPREATAKIQSKIGSHAVPKAIPPTPHATPHATPMPTPSVNRHSSHGEFIFHLLIWHQKRERIAGSVRRVGGTLHAGAARSRPAPAQAGMALER
jgi:hypothetical protein